MKSISTSLFFLLGIAFTPVELTAAAPSDTLVTVTPKETDEILANPGMGWETFHRTRTDDKNLPSWIPSTVHYARWGWRDFEPVRGKIDFDFLDKALKASHAAGQTLAFRVMCCSTSQRGDRKQLASRFHRTVYAGILQGTEGLAAGSSA